VVSEKQVVSAQIDKEARDELVRLAHEADRTLSAEVRRAIAEHLAAERNEAE
jgi:predicted transcriptional regulator